MTPQLHATALQTFARCPEQFRRRYIEGERRAPGIAMAVGTATHAAIEADMRQKLQTGELLPGEAIADLARDRTAELFAGEMDLTEEEAATGGKAAQAGPAQDKAIRLATLHHAQVAPGLQPAACERPFALDIGPALEPLGITAPFDLVGTIDLEVVGGDGAPNAIHDAKTTAKAPDQNAAEQSLQLAAYALAKRTLDGDPPSSLVLDYLVDNKTPKHVRLVSLPTDDRERALVARIGVVAQAMQAGLFPPAPPDAWWCSARFCGFHSTCPYVHHSMKV